MERPSLVCTAAGPWPDLMRSGHSSLPSHPLSPTFGLKIRAFSTSPAMSIPCLICVVILLLTELAAGYGPNISAPFACGSALNSFTWLPAIALPDLVSAYKAQLGINMWKNPSSKKHGPCHWSNCFYSGNELAVRHTHRNTNTQTHRHKHTHTSQRQKHTHISHRQKHTHIH